MKQLYKIADEYLLLEAMLDDTDENLVEAVEEALIGMNDSLAEKTDNICNLMASWDDSIAACAGEIKRLQERKKTFENRKAGLKKYLWFTLNRMNMPKVETDTHTVSLRKGALSCVVDDLDLLPSQYKGVTVTPLKAEIKAALGHGEVPGAHLERGADTVVIE